MSNESEVNPVAVSELLAISCVESHFFRTPDFHTHVERSQHFIDECLASPPNYNPESKILEGVVRSRVFMLKDVSEDYIPDDIVIGHNHTESDPRVILAIVIYTYVVLEIDGTVSEKRAIEFFESFAVFSAWPYLRQQVAKYAADASLELPILPIKRLRRKVSGLEPAVGNVPQGD